MSVPRRPRGSPPVGDGISKRAHTPLPPALHAVDTCTCPGSELDHGLCQRFGLRQRFRHLSRLRRSLVPRSCLVSQRENGEPHKTLVPNLPTRDNDRLSLCTAVAAGGRIEGPVSSGCCGFTAGGVGGESLRDSAAPCQILAGSMLEEVIAAVNFRRSIGGTFDCDGSDPGTGGVAGGARRPGGALVP